MPMPCTRLARIRHVRTFHLVGPAALPNMRSMLCIGASYRMEALVAMEQLAASCGAGIRYRDAIVRDPRLKPAAASLPCSTGALIAALEKGKHDRRADGHHGSLLHQPGPVVPPFGANAHLAGNVGDVAAEEVL